LKDGSLSSAQCGYPETVATHHKLTVWMQTRFTWLKFGWLLVGKFFHHLK